MIIFQLRVIDVAEMVELGANIVQLFDVDNVEASFFRQNRDLVTRRALKQILILRHSV